MQDERNDAFVLVLSLAMSPARRMDERQEVSLDARAQEGEPVS